MRGYIIYPHNILFSPTQCIASVAVRCILLQGDYFLSNFTQGRTNDDEYPRIDPG